MNIDAVITWVDGDDARHALSRAQHNPGSYHQAATSSTRFASSGEIKYCVLSILRFCPFVRNIYIVTDQQTPAIAGQIALMPSGAAEKVHIVDHAVIYGEHADLLPVFSSRSIETMLHRIPGLSEHFIYFNDDMFIGRPLTPDFFFRSGKPVLRGTYKRARNPITRLGRLLRLGTAPAGFKEAQKKAAGIVGYRGRFFLADHLPYPMRRSTLQKYYEGQPEKLRAQASHRFRNSAQISPIGLTNHLELRDGSPHEADTPAGYIKPPKNARKWQKALRTVDQLEKGSLAAVCIQSLDEFVDAYRAELLRHLDDRYIPDGLDHKPH